MGDTGRGTSGDISSPDVSPMTRAGLKDVDEDYDASSDEPEEDQDEGSTSGRKKSSRFNETKAAYVLMMLKTPKESLKAGWNSLKRRASA